MDNHPPVFQECPIHPSCGRIECITPGADADNHLRECLHRHFSEDADGEPALSISEGKLLKHAFTMILRKLHQTRP